jgi:hypothetical protein
MKEDGTGMMQMSEAARLGHLRSACMLTVDSSVGGELGNDEHGQRDAYFFDKEYILISR